MEVAEGASVADIASQIGSGLARAAVAARLNGKLVDLSTVVGPSGPQDLEILTDKSDEALSILRHSTAHIMAAAVRRLYGKAVKFGIGPSIEDGFYYDFDLPARLADEDLARIEAAMAQIVAEAVPFVREEVPVEQAAALMREAGQDYKVELLKDIAAEALAQGEEIKDAEAKPEAGAAVSLYHTADFVDLCRGPHVPHAGKVPCFKLLSVAGSYWRGDSNRPMLQRIYGTVWRTDDELKTFLWRRDEARKRDHRRLGAQLDLFSFHDVSPGAPFWHPKGQLL